MNTLFQSNLAKLLNQAKNADHDAFRGIFEHISDRLFAYAVSRTSHREDALDIVQDTFVELWVSLKNFRYSSDEEFYGFVFLIAKRRLYRYFNAKKNETTLENNIAGEKCYEVKINDSGYLLKYINALKAHYRELLQLRYWSDMTYGEIASIMQIKEGTAKVWHHRAIRQLQVLMKNHDRTI